MSDAEPIRFRPEQEAILNYRGGKLGVAAVPGSGKTFILAHLAARLTLRLLQEARADDQREVLVVTFANAAVNAIRAKIDGEPVSYTHLTLPTTPYV
jgi:DNA helicase-2/ATP-dependent DNA helicase PcrA